MKHWADTVIDDACWHATAIPDHIRAGLQRMRQLLDEAQAHPFRTVELETIADKLSECTDLEHLSNLMWHAAISSGFQNFAIFVIDQGTRGLFPARICTSYNEEWITRYQERGYQYIDPVISEAMKSDRVFLFSDLEYSAPSVIEFWQDAESHRIGRNGICFTTVRRDGARISVVFSTSNTAENTKRNIQMNGFDLKFISELAVDCFCDCIEINDISHDMLSIDELRFLYTLATSPEPKSALGIMPKFGSNETIQAAIRSKLNVKTIFQAISIASSRGWFNLLPYHRNEVVRSFPKLEFDCGVFEPDFLRPSIEDFSGKPSGDQDGWRDQE
jgi:hypothetical protein